MSESIYINEEYRNRLPPLEKDEREKLKQLILAEKQIRNPLIYWRQTDELLDGHNRFEIYNELVEEGHDIKPPPYKAMDFASKDEAMRWMDDNARGQRSLTEKWRQILIGREYNATNSGKGKYDRNHVGQLDPHADRESSKVAKKHGVGEKSVRRWGNRAEVYDKIANAKGHNSKEAIAAIKVSQQVVDAAVSKLKKNATADEVSILISKEDAKVKRDSKKKKKKATSDSVAATFYEEAPRDSIEKMLVAVKDAGPLTPEEFEKRLGGVTQQRWFKMFVKHTHYMHIIETDGQLELFIDETERDLCTAIEKQLDRMRDWSKQQNRFKFDVDMYKKTIQDLYDLINKASTHK